MSLAPLLICSNLLWPPTQLKTMEFEENIEKKIALTQSYKICLFIQIQQFPELVWVLTGWGWAGYSCWRDGDKLVSVFCLRGSSWGNTQRVSRPVIWGGSRGSHDPPPPPVTSKLNIYPSNIFQNPPYCTNLQLKMKKNRMPPHPPP